MTPGDFGPAVAMEVTRITGGKAEQRTQAVATEVPFTIMADECELVTLLSTPSHLRELTFGFLYASCFIRDAADVKSFLLDAERWVAHVELARPPDPGRLRKRLFTSGCGKGVMYATPDELAWRHPVDSSLVLTYSQVADITRWIQGASPLSRETGGMHTAGLSLEGDVPDVAMDDIGRHNAVDKVIGDALIRGVDLSRQVLVCSGRVSSEILQKARRGGLAIVVARGAPTHQSVLRARDMGMTLVGFARRGGFTIYSHAKRIVSDRHDG